MLLAVGGTDRDSATVSTNSGHSWAGVVAVSNSIIVNGSTASAAGGGIIVDECAMTGTSTSGASESGTITSSAYNAVALQILAPAIPVSFPPVLNLNPMLPLLAR
jgi:hypothetical protein